MSLDLVVARYNECVKWLGVVPPEYNIFLYDKSYGTEGRKLPNVGREAHTYLFHICERYDKLADYTVFCQGDPFHHLPNFLFTLDEAAQNPQDYQHWAMELTCDPHGAPHHKEDLKCNDIARVLIGRDLPTEMRFSCGAQFQVSRKMIRRIPLENWQKALALSQKERLFAWAMERVWPYCFERKKILAWRPW